MNADIRKRQRRQAAGALVSGLFGNNNNSSSGNGGGGGGGAVSIAGGGGTNAAAGSIAGGGTVATATTATGRKSTAQPRPSIHIPPRGIGPVYSPNSNDVLCGRGGRINAHSGNVQFRELVQSRKVDYLSERTKKLEKAHIASAIVRQIREMNPPGRFLKEDPDGSWYDIGDAKAIKKVGQALREDAPDIRGDIHAGSDDDEPPDSGGGGAQAPIMTVVPLPPASAPSMVVVAPGTTVSARGGKMSTAPTAPPHPGGPSRGSGGGDPYNVAPMCVPSSAGGKFSGAAAAAVQGSEYMPAPPDRDVAFGRQFHMALPETGSDISGLSYVPGTILSGMSGVSALTDPSLLGGVQSHMAVNSFPNSRQAGVNNNSLRISQLRQQWAAQHYGNSLQGGDNSSTTRMMLSSQNGLGNSLQASGAFNSSGTSRGTPHQRSHSSRSFHDIQSVNDAMSWAEHSLAGGGISGGGPAAQHRSNSYNDGASVANASVMQHSVSGSQSLFGANQSLGSYSMGSKDDLSVGIGQRYRQQLQLAHHHHNQQQQQQQLLHHPSSYHYNGMSATTDQHGGTAGTVAGEEDPSVDRSKSTTSSRSTTHQRNVYYGAVAGGGGAAGDRSIHSAGDESVSMQSIVSNLSENLIALDLAGTHATTSSLLDHL